VHCPCHRRAPLRVRTVIPLIGVYISGRLPSCQIENRPRQREPLLLRNQDSVLTPIIGKEAIVNSEAGCTVCSQARLLKAVLPVTKGYELKHYECASCGSDLWLVTRVFRSFAPKQQSGRSRRGTRRKANEEAPKGASRAAANPKPKAPQREPQRSSCLE
jgi:hypothetical protein